MKNHLFSQKRLVYEGSGPSGMQSGNEMPAGAPPPVTAAIPAAPTAAPTMSQTTAPAVAPNTQQQPQSAEALAQMQAAAQKPPEKPVTLAESAATGKGAIDLGAKYTSSAQGKLAIFAAIGPPEIKIPV